MKSLRMLAAAAGLFLTTQTAGAQQPARIADNRSLLSLIGISHAPTEQNQCRLVAIFSRARYPGGEPVIHSLDTIDNGIRDVANLRSIPEQQRQMTVAVLREAKARLERETSIGVGCLYRTPAFQRT